MAASETSNNALVSAASVAAERDAILSLILCRRIASVSASVPPEIAAILVTDAPEYGGFPTILVSLLEGITLLAPTCFVMTFIGSLAKLPFV